MIHDAHIFEQSPFFCLLSELVRRHFSNGVHREVFTLRDNAIHGSSLVNIQDLPRRIRILGLGGRRGRGLKSAETSTKKEDVTSIHPPKALHVPPAAQFQLAQLRNTRVLLPSGGASLRPLEHAFVSCGTERRKRTCPCSRRWVGIFRNACFQISLSTRHI